jgi:hypothetical protein
MARSRLPLGYLFLMISWTSSISADPFRLAFRRMPASSYPLASDQDRDYVIELQRNNCCTTTCSAPYDARPIRTPQEMSRPALATGVEQIDAPTSQWVTCGRLRSLEAVAHPTGKPQVFFRIGTTPCLRYDMVNLQRPKHILLQAQAISTAILSLCPHACASGIRHLTCAHGPNGSRRPRRTASCSAWAFRKSPSS